MPATRSRTVRWRDSLRQLYERGGSLEISAPRPEALSAGGGSGGLEQGADLIWRCRVLGLSDTEILLERPTALGEPVPFEAAAFMLAVIAIGQNRWMFHTRCRGAAQVDVDGRRVAAIRIEMPRRVERCQRRSFYRISTGGLILPTVDVRSLLNVRSATPAETALETRIEMMRDGHIAGYVGGADQPLVTPECGPPCRASLVNIGGGGAGLLFEAGEADQLDRTRPLWLMIGLAPHVPAPLGVVARVAHRHIDSQRRLYAGVAFEFDHNPAHRRFVTDLLCRYVADVQRDQARREQEINSTA